MAERECLLVATDFSESANCAVERAAILAEQHGFELILVHVARKRFLSRLRWRGLPDKHPKYSDLKNQLEHQAEAIRVRHGIDISTRLLTGARVGALNDFAKKIAPKMIVLGAYGHSPVKDIVIGSTGLQLLQTTIFPLLIVKNLPHHRYQRVLVPIDFNMPSLRALELAQSVAPEEFIDAIHFFELFSEPTLRYAGVEEAYIETQRSTERVETNQKLRDFVNNAGVPSENLNLLVLFGNPIYKIVEFERHMHTDLICMGSRTASTLERALLGSVSEQILTASQSDLLVVK